MSAGRFLFLGTGGAAGVPQIGCHCDVCRSKDPLNKRLRAAGLITLGKSHILIDAGPDLREQALTYHISDLAAVLLTHSHADHVAGIDDLRPYYFLHKKKLPCVLSNETYAEVKIRYHYLLEAISSSKSISAQIDFQVLPSDFGVYKVEGAEITYFSYYQVGTKVTGFRLGGFAYVTDIRTYSEQVEKALQGVDVLVLSAPRRRENHAHWGLDEALAFSRKVAAKKTYVTHITHDLEHHALSQELPQEVSLAHDGLEIAFTY
jgi:phosphoribosyl 1,2-cyclic phosphate phosphodiesterase